MNPTQFVHETEAYALLEKAGLLPPRYASAGGQLPFEAGEPVVVKGLGEDVWHKSELGAVHFLPFERRTVLEECNQMHRRLEAGGHHWIDGLVCEQIDIARHAHLPSEAIVSLAHSEAGWTLIMGFGGVQAETLAKLAPPLSWPLAFTQPADAAREFEAHLLGRIWLGRLRDSAPLTTNEAISELFRSLWKLAEVAEAAGLVLLELNPIALDLEGRPRPLDAVGSRGSPAAPRAGPPAGFLEALCAPRRIALAGVSAQEGGVGRTILDNLRRYALPAGDLVLVKPGKERFLGLPCLPDLAALRRAPVDLLILALPAAAAAATIDELIALGGGAGCVALVAGGLGDGADHAGLGDKLVARLRQARAAGHWTPAVLGPNFLGHWVPGRHLDTSFIPIEKLAAPPVATGDLTLLSQSGAFLLSRRSRQPALRFRLGVALGNQFDVALCDMLAALAAANERGPIAAYVEGFGPGQLFPTAQAVRALGRQGRRVLIHRAGRTEAGQQAAASHTGAIAGDLTLERSLLERAGARFAGSIAEFDAALGWLSAYPELKPGPVAVLTNAGFESVNGSDLFGPNLKAAELSPSGKRALTVALAGHELAGLVAQRLPLDLTPMANESAFLDTADILLRDAAVLVVGLVPFTRRLDTTAAGGVRLGTALAALRTAHGKPVAVAVDAGPDYEEYRRALGQTGLPVFDRVETALLGLRVLA